MQEETWVSLPRKPISAEANSPVRKNSPGAFGTSVWYWLFRNSSDTDLEHCCPLYTEAHCQVSSWHTPKPTLVQSCTLRTTQLAEMKGAMPFHTSRGYHLWSLFYFSKVRCRTELLPDHLWPSKWAASSHHCSLIIVFPPTLLHSVPLVFCLFLPVHQRASALAGMLIGTVNGWGRTVTECKAVIIHLVVSSLEKWLSIMAAWGQ